MLLQVSPGLAIWTPMEPCKLELGICEHAKAAYMLLWISEKRSKCSCAYTWISDQFLKVLLLLSSKFKYSNELWGVVSPCQGDKDGLVSKGTWQLRLPVTQAVDVQVHYFIFLWDLCVPGVCYFLISKAYIRLLPEIQKKSSRYSKIVLQAKFCNF